MAVSPMRRGPACKAASRCAHPRTHTPAPPPSLRLSYRRWAAPAGRGDWHSLHHHHTHPQGNERLSRKSPWTPPLVGPRLLGPGGRKAQLRGRGAPEHHPESLSQETQEKGFCYLPSPHPSLWSCGGSSDGPGPGAQPWHLGQVASESLPLLCQEWLLSIRSEGLDRACAHPEPQSKGHYCWPCAHITPLSGPFLAQAQPLLGEVASGP